MITIDKHPIQPGCVLWLPEGAKPVALYVEREQLTVAIEQASGRMHRVHIVAEVKDGDRVPEGAQYIGSLPAPKRTFSRPVPLAMLPSGRHFYLCEVRHG